MAWLLGMGRRRRFDRDANVSLLYDFSVKAFEAMGMGSKCIFLDRYSDSKSSNRWNKSHT